MVQCLPSYLYFSFVLVDSLEHIGVPRVAFGIAFMFCFALFGVVSQSETPSRNSVLVYIENTPGLLPAFSTVKEGMIAFHPSEDTCCWIGFRCSKKKTVLSFAVHFFNI